MSDTPRTDAREKAYWAELTSHVDDVWAWAQQLERENAALRKALALLADESQILVNIIQMNTEKSGICVLRFDMTSGVGMAILEARAALRKEAQP